MSGLNFRHRVADKAGVDQVSRPMQIALVAVVLLAGMWFTVLKPKPAEETAVTPATPTPAAKSSAPVAPGVKGLVKAVDKAKAASATSDATNAKIQSATGGSAKAKATTSVAPAKKTLTAKPATTASNAKVTVTKAKAKAPAATVDPSDRLLANLAKGKTLVILFEGKGADDKAARKAVHLTAKADPKHVVSAYVPISKVGDYEKITTDVEIYGSPTILVIGADRKATALTGFLDAPSVQQAVGDVRREAAGAKSAAKK
jgi:hypothetical protein